VDKLQARLAAARPLRGPTAQRRLAGPASLPASSACYAVLLLRIEAAPTNRNKGTVRVTVLPH
jgi:hypothetical protein